MDEYEIYDKALTELDSRQRGTIYRLRDRYIGKEAPADADLGAWIREWACFVKAVRNGAHDKYKTVQALKLKAIELRLKGGQ